LKRIAVAPRELKLATDLIGALAADWKPGQYVDDYQENLAKLIKQKMKGQTITLEGEHRPMRAEVVDLAERLKASLEAAGKSGRRTTATASAAKTRKPSAAAKKRREPAA
jgi:DNA end-binding protein Ku